MAEKFVKHYTDWPKADWPWTYFSPREMASKREGELMLDLDAMNKLQALRNHLGKPLIITSAYRSAAHNRAVGGAKNSYHMRGMAFDIRMDNHDPEEFERAARLHGFRGFGFYPRSGFMHIDTGPAREWGKRWPKTATNIALEPNARPEKLRSDPEARAVAGVGGGIALAALPEAVPAIANGLGDWAPAAQVAGLVIVGLLLALYFWKRW